MTKLRKFKINQFKARKSFDSYIKRAELDNRIVGVVMGGGRAKDVYTECSDFDIYIVTTDEGLESVKKDYPKTRSVDSTPMTLSQFRKYAKLGTATAHHKFAFTYNRAIIDKSGQIQRLVEKKGELTNEEAVKLAKESLGKYFNMLHRSLKNIRDANLLAGHLDAAESISFLLTFIFAQEKRVRPFNKFLLWELTKHPLKKLPVSNSYLIDKINAILSCADPDTQIRLMKIIKRMALKNGFRDEIAFWKKYYFG